MASLRHTLPDTLAPNQEAGAGGVPLFHAAPRPDHAAPYPAWLDARDHIEAALGRPGVVALVGPAGIGKTLLLHQVAQRIRAAGRAPALLNGTTGLRAALPGDPDVILIDDADRLPVPLLTALARHGRPVLIVSDGALADTLHTAGLHPTVVELGPLSWKGAQAFLSLQLAMAGQPANLIQPSAVVQMFDHSGGNPRSLQMLAGLAVFVARLADVAQVTPSHVIQAASIQAGTHEDEDEEADPASRAPAEPPDPAAPATPQVGRVRRGGGVVLLVTLAAVGLCGGMVLGSGTMRAPQPGPEVPQKQAALPTGPVPSPMPLLPPRPAPAAPSAPLNIVVVYPSTANAAVQADILADALRRSGYQVPPPQPAPVREQPAVSFAFAEDAATAEALGHATGLNIVQSRPIASSRPGTVRVVLGPVARQQDPDPPFPRKPAP